MMLCLYNKMHRATTKKSIQKDILKNTVSKSEQDSGKGKSHPQEKKEKERPKDLSFGPIY